MGDYIVTSANLINNSKDNNQEVDIEIRNGLIDDISPSGGGDPSAFDDNQHFDADGKLVTPPLIEAHTHLYGALIAGNPRFNQTGTLEEGWRLWDDTRETLSKENYKKRAKKAAHWYIANGVTSIRTHLDVNSDESVSTAIEAIKEVKKDLKGMADIQIVGFPMGCIHTGDENKLKRLEDAIKNGIDVVGGIPHREHTDEDGNKHVKTVLDLAEKYDLQADLHIDETDDPNSRFTGTLASESLKRGLGDRVTASHACALHSYPDAYADKLVRLIGESGINVVTNPMTNAALQGRYDDFPRRRGHTRIKSLREQGVAVGIGQDSVADHFHSYGDGDMLKTGFILAHYAHMNGKEDADNIWEMLLHENASVLGIDNNKIIEGNEGSLVVYDSSTSFDAIRTQPVRSLVLRDGKPIAKSTQQNTVIKDSSEKSIKFDF